jgi:hypothetical protein
MSARLYSLFEKRGFRYHRLSQLAYKLSAARNVFQSALLTGMCLRPVQDSWEGSVHICRPPVERVPGSASATISSVYEELADNLTNSVMRRLNEPVVVKPAAKGYRTPQKAVRA